MMHVAMVLGLLASTPEPSTPHRLEVYARSGAAIFMSPARFQGGLGGGFGLRDTVQGRWLLQADVAGFMGITGVGLSARLGAGVQRRGRWRPAARLELAGLFGDRAGVASSAQPRFVSGPALMLAGVLAPLRFGAPEGSVSLFEVGVGTGPDGPGWGLHLSVTLIEVGITL